MSNIDKQALNQEKIEWLNKLADMEYCKSNPGHWLMSLKDTNMLAKLALRSVALLDEMEAKDKRLNEILKPNMLLPVIDDMDADNLRHVIKTVSENYSLLHAKWETAEKKTVEMPTFDGYVPHVARELQAAFRIACDNAGINVAAAGKGE
ncbi:ead/Ea22-like family protein [Enterobacter hormaechei]|uniref:ead/Ea22-like family protein n=1 Tax=Enterobacter hormaechei TaxID=158836 RepID=UPI00254C1AF3|nr:ead/Ea22-like family protein [Enterobacter hormaechei]MDL0032908.1 ead/Ea22-like family protein [Enterobacter hormaechei]